MESSPDQEQNLTTVVEPERKTMTLERNDAEWDAIKDDIFRVYMAENNTLATTMFIIEQTHSFTRSPRKWKQKLKEWEFVKNLTMTEAKAVVAKAEKRAREDGKDTMFFHRGNPIPPDKVSNLRRRLTAVTSSPIPSYLQTPATIAYFTPRYSISMRKPELKENEPSKLILAGTKRKTISPDEEWPPDRLQSLIDKAFKHVHTAPFHIISEFFTITEGLEKHDELANHGTQVNHKTSIYAELKVQKGTVFPSVCRFQPAFWHLLFYVTGKPHLHLQFREIVVMIIHSKTDHSTSYQLLLEFLGRALVKTNEIDSAILLAKSMDQALRSTCPSMSFQLWLGDWYNSNQLFQQSLPYLQDAFVHHLVTSSELNGILWTDAPDILLQHSYHELQDSFGCDNSHITDRGCSVEGNLSLRFWNKLKGEARNPPVATMLLLKPHLKWLKCVLEPEHLVNIDLTLANHHVQSSLQESRSYIQRAWSRLIHTCIDCNACFVGIRVLREWTSPFIYPFIFRTPNLSLMGKYQNALEILIQELLYVVERSDDPPICSGIAHKVYRLHLSNILLPNRRPCQDDDDTLEVIIDFINERSGNTIEQLHAWRPDIFSSSTSTDSGALTDTSKHPEKST